MRGRGIQTLLHYAILLHIIISLGLSVNLIKGMAKIAALRKMPEELPSAVQSLAIPWQNAIRSDGMSAEVKLRKAVHGGPNGNRTRVSGVRGQRPRPLDDGTLKELRVYSFEF